MIEKIKSGLIELPPEKKNRFVEQYNFLPENAELLVADRSLADFTEHVISELRAWIDSNGDDWERQKIKLARATSNWILSELFKHLKNGSKIADLKMTAENFAELILLVYLEKINSSAGQKILEVLIEKGGEPKSIMKDLGLEQMDDTAELEKIVSEIIEKNAKQVEEYKSGKQNILQFFVGQTMAATKGKANPKIVVGILKEKLK